MKLKYRNGATADDELFDHAVDVQRCTVAMYLGLGPDPKGWPVDMIDNLLAFRKQNGVEEFTRRVLQMMTKPGD